MLTLTLTTPLTNEEAGAAAALLLTLYPDALQTALNQLDADQLQLPLVVTRYADHAVVAPEAPSAAEAFAPGTQPPESGAPFVAGPAAAPPVPPAPSVAGAAAPESNEGVSDGPAVPATAPVAGVELDAEGLPWDARIHATPASKTKKLLWRAKKNLNQLTANKVKSELLAALAAPAAGAAPAPPPPIETPAERTLREAVAEGLVPGAPPIPPVPVAATPAPPAAPAPVAAVPAPPPETAASVAPVPAPSPVPPAPSPAPSVEGDATPPGTLFANAMRKVTAAQTAGHITVEETNSVIQQLGLTAVRDLMQRPDLIPTFEQSVDLHVQRFVPAAG